jgi:hypothetical protein
VIRPEQLAQALDRIHPRDRELLSLSLRRRVPDEALGRLYDCDATEVARRRARAIERLADEMELQRGEDLGAVLSALLEPGTWSAVAASLGEEFAMGAAGGRVAPMPLPEDPEIAPAPALAPVPAPEEQAPEAAPLRAAPPAQPPPPRAAPPPQPREAPPPKPRSPREAPPVQPPSPQAAPPPQPPPPREAPPVQPPPPRDAPPPKPLASVPPAPAEPVLEMLAAREREAPDPPRRAVPMALFGLAIAALVGAGALVGATQFGHLDRVLERDGGTGDDGTRHFVPERGGPLAAPFPSDPSTVSCYSTATTRRAAVLYREPGGRKRVTLTARTEWGSPRVLGVVKQRGGWLGVQAPELRNGEIGWLRRDEAGLDCVRWSLHADLSKRRLFVRRDGHTVRKLTMAIGRAGNPTPEGRFTVTDKLRVTDPGSPYGCCVLALTGHQTHLPEDWPGGDRLAVHATGDTASIGRAVSLGCMRVDARQAKWLIDRIPLGAPIFIRS